MAKTLTQEALMAALATLPDWQVTQGRPAIRRRFRFGDFSEAFGFMARAALEAERLDHHPEWTNVYNRVDVTLTTHDAGGITEKDIDLARRLDTLA